MSNLIVLFLPAGRLYYFLAIYKSCSKKKENYFDFIVRKNAITNRHEIASSS